MFGHAQSLYRIVITGIAEQVVSTYTLDGNNPAFPEIVHHSPDGGIIFDDPGFPVMIFEYGPAYRAGNRFGMESPVADVPVFRGTIRTHGECMHAGVYPVIG